MRNKMGVIISFDMEALGQDGLKTLFEIEKKLQEIGITFDTGAGFGKRDWQWDYSLEGPVEINIVDQGDVDIGNI